MATVFPDTRMATNLPLTPVHTFVCQANQLSLYDKNEERRGLWGQRMASRPPPGTERDVCKS